MKNFNRDEFLNDLKAVLDKHKVRIGIDYANGSDMTAVYDLHFNVTGADDIHNKPLMRFDDLTISSYEVTLLQQGDDE